MNNLVVARTRETSSVLSLVTGTDVVRHVVAEKAPASKGRDKTHAYEEGIYLVREELGAFALGSRSEEHRSTHFNCC